MKVKKTIIKYKGQQKEVEEVGLDEILDHKFRRTKLYHKNVPIEKKLEKAVKNNIHLKCKTESKRHFAIRIAKQIIKEYEENLVKEMVQYQNPFVFPQKDFAVLFIAPLKRDILNEFKGKKPRYVPFIFFKEAGLIQTNKVGFQVRLKRKYYAMVEDEVKKGVRYQRLTFTLDKEKIQAYKKENQRVRRIFYFNKK